MKQPTFAPIIKPARHYDFIALDSEGSGARGDFKIAVLYDERGPQVFYERYKLKQHLFSRGNTGKVILAANLEYDYATCFQPFNGHFDIMIANRKWLKASYHDNDKHAWVAWDIQRIAPLSVAEMGRIVNLPKLATPPELISDPQYRPDPWSCSTHRRAFCVECYCIRDAEITYAFACLFQETINGMGGEMKLTTASCAMDLFRRKYLRSEIAATLPARNQLARQAYYGGRVEVFRIGTSYDVNVYDFNSLYPSIMLDVEVGLPHTYRRMDAPRTATPYLDNFGQFIGEIELPTGFVGLLPFRQGERLYFPTGTVSGSWTLAEVRHALDNGARIKRTLSITYARETVKLFNDYVTELYAYRQQLEADGDTRAKVVKLMMNGLYGKFAQNDDGNFKSLITPSGDYDLRDYYDDEPVIVAGREAFLRDRDNGIQPPHVHVLWACEITSQARLRLYNALMVGQDKIVYCDTDSVHTTGTFPASDALGRLKVEHELARGTYFAPKEYGGEDKSGELVQRAKGIPPQYRTQYLAQGFVEFKQPVHTLTAINKGGRIAEWVSVQKHRRSDAMNRRHDYLPDFNAGRLPTFPFDSGELTG